MTSDAESSSSRGDQREDEGEDEDEEEREAVQVEMCPSVCREVERKCPFFILGHEDDKAAGNPSFICKGRKEEQCRSTSKCFDENKERDNLQKFRNNACF